MQFGNFEFNELEIEGVFLIEPKVFGDQRGYFLESYSKRAFEKAGITENFVQVNQSKSKKGVLRGIHYQTQHPQGKLVRVIYGEVYDVAVDIRKNSKTYGRYVAAHLSADNQQSLYIPAGLGHGFLVLSEEAVFTYQTTDFYYPEFDAGIRYNDPDIKITWPQMEELFLSDKDKQLPYLREIKE